MLKAMRQGVPRAALEFGLEEAGKLKGPWCVATDSLRRVIRDEGDEGLPYRATKYQTEGGWAVRVVRVRPRVTCRLSQPKGQQERMTNVWC
jgi:hypothetical protein